MLVCYLDDSGKDPQNPITTVAGYAGTEDQWRGFEIEVESIFADYRVKVLHAKDLHNTDNEFDGWSILKKQAFVARICRVLSYHVALGMSTSVAKEPYARRVAESGNKRPITPYSWAFNLLVEWVLTDIRVGRIAHTEGVSFILESGHDNNAEAERIFQKIRRIHNLENVLRSISFVSKASCRAIQMADLFAFYSRRHGAVMCLAPPEAKLEMRDNPGTMLNIITEAIPHRAYVATDFGPDAPGTRFFGGPLEGE